MNVNDEYVNISMWNIFCSRFKSDSTAASYCSDIQEFCRFTGKKFEDTDKDNVQNYYNMLQKEIREGRLKPLTVTKKFRELHSFASFLISEGEMQSYSDHDPFWPYLKNMEKESALADSIPVEDMDALLRASKDDKMAYTILTLLYRAGLTSTEIISLKAEDDFFSYENSIYVLPAGRKEPCYIPADAWEILKDYMNTRSNFPSLFYNRSGRPLNTMYISRMMKKYCQKAGISNYSAQDVRNTCAFNLCAYGVTPAQTAEQMGRTEQQINRYYGSGYRNNLKKHVSDLVKIRIEKP